MQYYGWALKNRVGADADRRAGAARRRRGRGASPQAPGPDRHRRGGAGLSRALPKPCVGGWGRRSLNVTPSGRVLPCHAAESIPELEFWNVRDHSLADIWAHSPAFNAFRGTDFLPAPCASCERREIDFGGCRCQAFLLTGDARATDPVCHLSPHHGLVDRACRGARGRRLRLPAHVTPPDRREPIARGGRIVRNSRQGRPARCDAGPSPAATRGREASAPGRSACRFQRRTGVD